MAKKDAQTELTAAQRREVTVLRLNAFSMRGLQVFFVGLGAYLAAIDGRGWPSFVIGLGIAAWFQCLLPVLPRWLDKMRPPED